MAAVARRKQQGLGGAVSRPFRTLCVLGSGIRVESMYGIGATKTAAGKIRRPSLQKKAVAPYQAIASVELAAFGAAALLAGVRSARR